MKKYILSLLMSLTLLVVLAFHPSQNMNGILKVYVTGLRNSNGEVIFYLFDGKDGFPDDKTKAFRCISSKIIGDSCAAIFENLPFGQYAIFCYHDENNDKKLNKTWYGKPNEGVAFSNNVRGSIAGAPAFEKAERDFKSKIDSLTIKMSYF